MLQADMILHNGIIHTQNDQVPVVSAIAIRGAEIIAAGSDEDILHLSRPDTEIMNLDGRLVLPGLTDAHVHLSLYADALQSIDLNGAGSSVEAVERVRRGAEKARPGEWVRGRGWAQDSWPDRAFPTAGMLDAMVRDHPVYLSAHSAHAAWVNSAALRLAGITRDTPDPDGGRIGRDAQGLPDGILYESAMALVTRAIPGMIGHFVTPEFAPEVIAEQTKAAIARAHRGGLTGIHDFDGAGAFQAYQMLRERGELSLRIVKNIPAALLDHAIGAGLRWGFGDEYLRIGGVKQFADGALGPRTGWMIAPYEGEPDNRGICVTDPEVMMDVVSRASTAGLPSTIHAIGDRAVHEVLNVYEAVRKQEAAAGIRAGERRHRIEHVQVIHPDDVPRLAQLGIIASMQPNHATSDMDMSERYWGERSEFAYNWRLQLDAGATLALGSDAPIEPIEPLPNIQAAVTRRRADGSPGPDGWRPGTHKRLTVDEAVRGFTRGPAYAAGMEDRVGQIAPGYLADVVILGQNIYECDPMAIGETEVLGTLVGGRWVWRKL